MRRLSAEDLSNSTKLLSRARALRWCGWVIAGGVVLMVALITSAVLQTGDASNHMIFCMMVPLQVLGGHACVLRSRVLTRLAENRCPACGYDQRQTPERCPECGLQRGAWANFLVPQSAPHAGRLQITYAVCSVTAMLLLSLFTPTARVIGWPSTLTLAALALTGMVWSLVRLSKGPAVQ